MQLDQRVLRTSESTVSGYVHRDFHARALRRNMLTRDAGYLAFAILQLPVAQAQNVASIFVFRFLQVSTRYSIQHV